MVRYGAPRHGGGYRSRNAWPLLTALVFFLLLFPLPAEATGPETGPAEGATVGVVERSGPAAGQSSREDELKGQYSKVLQDIIQGIYEGDYSRFSRNLNEQMRVTQNRQAFLTLQKKIQTNLGKLQSLDYLGFYSQGGSTMALFKARFSKDNDDVLITLVFDRGSTSKQVSGMWLDSPSLER